MRLLLLLACVAIIAHGNPIDEDVTGETMDPVTGMTGDTGSPTGSAKPVTFVPGTSSMIPISIVTGGTSETTENPSPMTVEPISGETTAMPVTFQPVTHTTAPHGQTTQPGTKITKTTTAPTTTPKPKSSGFDGGSFAGGIALGAGIAIILYIIYRVYSARKTKDYRTM